MTAHESRLLSERALVRKPVDQLGFVVPSLEAAIKDWLSLGVGPWFTVRSAITSGLEYRGRPTTPGLDAAFSYVGEIQLELIHAADDEPSIYRDFTVSGKGGLHHFGWFTTDLAADRAAALASGHKLVQGGSMLGTEFACFELAEPIQHPAHLIATGETTALHAELILSKAAEWDGTLAEVLSPSRQSRRLFERVNETVRRWDGWTAPVRPLLGPKGDAAFELHGLAQRISRWAARDR